MSVAFLDASAWYSALSPAQTAHAATRATYRAWITGGVTIVTTNLVVAEVHILVVRWRGTAAGIAFLDSVYREPSHEVVFADRDLGALSATYVLLLAVGGSLAIRFADSFGAPWSSTSRA